MSYFKEIAKSRAIDNNSDKTDSTTVPKKDTRFKPRRGNMVVFWSYLNINYKLDYSADEQIMADYLFAPVQRYSDSTLQKQQQKLARYEDFCDDHG